MSCEMRSMMTSYFFGSSMQMPPILTNSAFTPSTFSALIFSTNAGGKVFSMPKRIPIFLVLTGSPFTHNARLGSRGRRRPRNRRQVAGATPLKIFCCHSLPQRPVVLAVIAVNIQPVRDAFGVHDPSHFYVCVQTHIPICRTQHNLHLPDAAQEPVIAHIGQVIRGIVEIDIVVIVAVEKTLDVERATHGHARGNDIGVTHGKIQRVISAEAAACDGDLRSPVLPLEKRQKFIDDIALILHVPPDPRAGVHALVVPALAIYA